MPQGGRAGGRRRGAGGPRAVLLAWELVHILPTASEERFRLSLAVIPRCWTPRPPLRRESRLPLGSSRGEGQELWEECWGQTRPAGPSLRPWRVPGAGCSVNTEFVFMSVRDIWCLPHLMSTQVAFSPKAKRLEDQGRRLLLFPDYLLGSKTGESGSVYGINSEGLLSGAF